MKSKRSNLEFQATEEQKKNTQQKRTIAEQNATTATEPHSVMSSIISNKSKIQVDELETENSENERMEKN